MDIAPLLVSGRAKKSITVALVVAGLGLSDKNHSDTDIIIIEDLFNTLEQNISVTSVIMLILLVCTGIGHRFISLL